QTGAGGRIFPVTVQGAAEGPTALAETPQRIVPLGRGLHQILRALGLEPRTVTVDDSLVGLPLVAQIKKARPDLIVASTDVDPLDLARARSATNAAVYVTPDRSCGDERVALRPPRQRERRRRASDRRRRPPHRPTRGRAPGDGGDPA